METLTINSDDFPNPRGYHFELSKRAGHDYYKYTLHLVPTGDGFMLNHNMPDINEDTIIYAANQLLTNLRKKQIDNSLEQHGRIKVQRRQF